MSLAITISFPVIMIVFIGSYHAALGILALIAYATGGMATLRSSSRRSAFCVPQEAALTGSSKAVTTK